MAGVGENTATDSAAITGLREQILDNAMTLYPEVVKDYQRSLVGAGVLVKAADIFKVVIVEDVWTRFDMVDSKFYFGVKAVLLYSCQPCAAPERVIEGPTAQYRREALEFLLQATERCIGDYEPPIVGFYPTDSDKIDIVRGPGGTKQAMVDRTLLNDNYHHAKDRHEAESQN